MSNQNTHEQKRIRRMERRDRKGRTRALWKDLGHFLGYVVKTAYVKGHDYLAFHNLPHSPHAAKLAVEVRERAEERRAAAAWEREQDRLWASH